MMHHDAITGTHKRIVGKDYSDMMIKAKQRSKDGLLGNAIHKMALGHGVELNDLEVCKLEGNVVHCDHFLGETSSILRGKRFIGIATVYNPNLESLNGFFLRVPRTMHKAQVNIFGNDEVLKTETFCSAEVSGMDFESLDNLVHNDLSATDTVCEVFVDYEVKSLTMSHLHVMLFSDYNGKTDESSRVVEPEVVYRYDYVDYQAKREGWF